MLMPGRRFTASTYRYGFNGKENDNNVKGEGNEQDYGMRIYDSRIGKFLSADPLSNKYPELTPYQFASNTSIQAIDLDGLEAAGVGCGCSMRQLESQNAMQQTGQGMVSAGVGFGKAGISTVEGTIKAITHPKQTVSSIIHVVSHPGEAWNNIKAGLSQWGNNMLSSYPKVAGEATGAGLFTLFSIAAPAPPIAKYLGNRIKSLTVLKGMSLTEKVALRIEFVKLKYASAIEKYGLDHIDFLKPVSEVNLSGSGGNGRKLVQWREPGNSTASPFFTYEGVDPGTLGIPNTYTQKYLVELPGKETFLETTANQVKAFSAKDPGINGMYNGGGIQLYSQQAAKKAIFTPVEH